MDLKSIDFSKLLASYPTHNHLPPHLASTLASLKKTWPSSSPCCMQMCEALNKVGLKIPGKKSFRPGDPKRVAAEIPLGSGVYYLLAVDEMNNFLKTFAEPSLIRHAAKGAAWDFKTITKSIRGLEGILTFGNDHIELWNKTNVVQDRGPSTMDANFLWGRSEIRFWQIGEARLMLDMPLLLANHLHGWWKVSDGNDYYYHFDKDTVIYTTRAPKAAHERPPRAPANMGDVTVVGWNIELDWDPSGYGATRETFALDLFDPTLMKGTSNRFDRLSANKMFV